MDVRGRAGFVNQLLSYVAKCRMYEDRAAQDAARNTVNVSELEEKALVLFAKEGKFDVSEHELDRGKLHQLCLWFKSSFRWVDKPPCEKCGGESVGIGPGLPNDEERKWQADRVELFRCKNCFNEVRFPRYNDPRKLLETRSGRCGEWANCFTLYCRALGYRARLVLDYTDHLWTECYLPLLGRTGGCTLIPVKEFWTSHYCMSRDGRRSLPTSLDLVKMESGMSQSVIPEHGRRS